jgi:2-polyprenyl-3-methyl-5-hydroxy-6-metoxy-1,4-benzoquinol methylase
MQTPNQETSSQPCNLCGGENVAVIGNRSRTGKPLRSVICNACGLVWADPLPHNPRTYYEDDYRVEYKGTFTPKPKHILRAGKVALLRRGLLGNLLAEPKAILDVGAGGGEFAYLLKSLGHTVTGIEPNKGYAEFSIKEYGVNIKNGFIQDIELPEQSFDLITIWHVLEHTENPTAVIEKLYALLKPEGILVVEVPTIEATCQSPKSTFHEAHIFTFNRETLRKLGEKADFIEQDYRLSHDGANITLFFKKTQAAAPISQAAITGNASKIKAIVANHTVLKHYLSLFPYQRLFVKLSRALGEKLATRNFTSGKQLLDTLYARHLN